MSTTVDPPFRASRYTTGAIVLHWTIALLIAVQILSGFAMTDILANGSPLQFQAYQLHKSLGISVLVLTIARILWRAFNPPPPEPASVGRREGFIAHTIHMVFYSLLIIIPLSGWLLITVAPVRIETILFFQSWLPWPNLPGFSGLSSDAKSSLTAVTEWVHAVLAYGMGLLVALHVAGAVKHHLADGAFIRRMALKTAGDGPRNSYGHATTWLVTLVFAGAMVGAATLARAPETSALAEQGVSPDQPAVLSSAAERGNGAEQAEGSAANGAGGEDGNAEQPATQWAVDRQASDLTFAFTFQGKEVTGEFARFDADIRFDPDNLEGSSIRVSIPTPSASVETNDISQSQLTGPDGFATEAHGTATYHAATIRSASSEDDGYIAEGTLTIRGETVPADLTFQVTIEGDQATADGSVTVNRLDFGIGAENDPSGDWVSEDVRIDVSILASRADTDEQSSGAEQASDTEKAETAEEARPAGETDPAPKWTMLPERSTVGFSFGFQGSTVEGAIEAFATEIRFDQDNLKGSSIYASLDLSSAVVDGNASFRVPASRVRRACRPGGAVRTVYRGHDPRHRRQSRQQRLRGGGNPFSEGAAGAGHPALHALHRGGTGGCGGLRHPRPFLLRHWRGERPGWRHDFTEGHGRHQADRHQR